MAIDEGDQTLATHCYKQLKEAIIHWELKPGEKLRMTKLKDLLKVGPTPIREALSGLVSSGLVEAEANRGFYVKSISEEEVRDIYGTFSKIELLALTQAIELGDTAWEASILASLHKLSQVEKDSAAFDLDKWLQLNYEFHLSLIKGCKSPSLLKIRDDIYQLFDRYCYLSMLNNPDRPSINHKNHIEIAKAVINRDQSKACKLMSLHLENSLKLVLKALKKYL